MRTKHLFYTAAMAALFAACVNDDFETIGQQGNVANDGRPVAGDVKLNFTKAGADTRLNFDENGYAWEATDEIGALLMDNVLLMGDEAKDATWLEKYQLVDNIHTSYRFYYNSTNKEWKADAKMLEGNYFFAYPWEDYDGNRQVTHSLINQEQNGIGTNVVAESYADNQFFIGYSPIMAGTGTNEVLNSNVVMVPLLGAIQLKITNTGTQTRHINKVVLSNHEGLSSVMTFDPTNAKYNGWNLEKEQGIKWISTAKYFNYANYTGNETDSYTAADVDNAVYNIGKDDKYNRIEALRKVAQGMDDKENSAQLVINGTEEERALLPDAKNTAYVLIMSNPLTKVEEAGKTADDPNTLYLTIYTDEGFVEKIDLGKVYNDSKENKVVTNSRITSVGPKVSNTIEIQIDDNSFVKPDDMEIYNSDDLMQFIKWNVAVAGNRDAKATLKKDVTFTAEMLKALEGNANTKLTIEGVGKKLTLAEDVPAAVLSHKQLTIAIDVDVVAEGKLTLNKNAKIVNNIEIAEGATANINDEFELREGQAKITITNKGGLNIADKVTVAEGVEFTNEAEMTIGADADVKGEITNEANATIDNEGYIANLTNNKAENDKDEDGVVNMIGKSTIATGTNNGVINAGKNSRVLLETNNGEVVMTELGAKVADKGTISYVTGDLELDDTTLEALDKANVNKLILTGDVTVANEKKTTDFITTIAAQDGSSLEVGEKATLTVTNLNIEGNTTTDGDINATNVTVDEDVVLTNYGRIKATKGVFTNNGKINNHGTVTYEKNAANKEGEFGYNKPSTTDPEDNSKQMALETAVEIWASYWDQWNNDQLSQFYRYNPYNVDAFIATMEEWNKSQGGSNFNIAANNLAKKLELADNRKESWEKALKTAAGAIPAFDTAVDNKIVTAANVTAMTTTLIKNGKLTVTPAQDGKLYASKTEVYEAMKTALAHKNLYTSVKGITNKLAAAVWGIEETTLENAMNAADDAVPYTYIWEGCKLDEVMTAYRMKSIKDWNTALGQSWTAEVTTMADLKIWMQGVLRLTNVSEADAETQDAVEVVKKYLNEYKSWQYSDAQVQAAGK